MQEDEGLACAAQAGVMACQNDVREQKVGAWLGFLFGCNRWL